MAISAIHFTRVSHNLRTMNLLQSLRRNTRELYIQQTRLASGKRFITASDDPVAASQSLKLNETISRQQQILANLRHADLILGSSDQALTEVNGLLAEAESIASASIGAQAGADERVANAALIASIRERLMTIGNRQVQGQHIFAGRNTDNPPFISALGGVAYVGDTGDLLARVSRSEEESINVPGNLLFGGLATAIVSTGDLSTALTAETRLEDLAGANLLGIRKGTVVLTESSGTIVQVDLTHADTVGDVVDMINAAAEANGLASAGFSVQIDGRGLRVSSGGITIRDTATGVTASDLGFLVPGSEPAGAQLVDLSPRISPNTPLEALNNGNGVSLDEGIRITNGSQTITLDLSEARTVQDIINKINTAGIFVFARINDAGTGLEIVSQVAGVDMSISENDGTTAADLGLLTFSPNTPLDSLNSGRGVEMLEGEPDLRIEAKSGEVVEVNLDGAQTLGDVVNMINEAATEAGVSIEAAFATDSNGIVVRDGTGGSAPLSINRASTGAFAVDDLGLLVAAEDPETQVAGKDVSMVRAQSVFTALIDLERTLRANDEAGITESSQRLQEFAEGVIRVHGVVGARARGIAKRVEQTENAVIATSSLLSNIEDLDYAQAVTVFQQAQTALQANLLSGSQLLSLSLLDFLR